MEILGMILPYLGMILTFSGMLMLPYVLFTSEKGSYGRSVGLTLSSFWFLSGVILIVLY